MPTPEQQATDRLKNAAAGIENDPLPQPVVVTPPSFFRTMSRTTIGVSGLVVGAAAGAGVTYVVLKRKDRKAQQLLAAPETM